MASGKLQVQNILALVIIALLGFVAYKLATQPQAVIQVQQPAAPTVAPVATNSPAASDNNTLPKVNANQIQPTTGAKAENEATPIPPFVPDLAIRGLIDRYPEAPLNTVKWQQQKYGLEAVFKNGTYDMEVEFDKEGNWIETEFEHAKESEVPFEVRELVKKQFSGATVQEYEIEHTKSGTFYEIELNYKGQEIEKYFDSKGSVAINENEDS